MSEDYRRGSEEVSGVAEVDEEVARGEKLVRSTEVEVGMDHVLKLGALA